MCDITLALAIGSTVLGAAGQLQQANAQASADRYNASVADVNAKIAERRAKDAIERGAVEEQRKRQQVQQLLGQQKLAMAANGLDVSFGSPLDVITDTAVAGELDALTIRSNAYREADDYRVDAFNKRSSASLLRSSASNAETGGWLAAAGTILGGGGNAYSKWKMA